MINYFSKDRDNDNLIQEYIIYELNTISELQFVDKKMRCIKLPRCATDNDIMLVAAFKNLHHIDLTCCSKITDEGLERLQGLKLHHLNLSGCYITDQGIGYFAGMELQYLNLMACGGVTDVGLGYLHGMPLRWPLDSQS